MTSDGSALRVLVADDDPSLRLALTLWIQRRGHRAFGAADTDAARTLLRDEEPDVVLVDAGMPRDGVAFWRECAGEGPPRAGALLLTGDVPGLGELSRDPRVVGKPFDFPALLDRIEAMAEAP
jgi:DNA-binding response OmpR family regulator